MIKPRVLQLIAGLDIGHRHGGAERFGLELAHALRNDFDVQVCAFWRCETPLEKVWQARLEEAGVTVFYAAPYGGRWNLAGFLRGLAALQQHIRGQPLEVVHSHFQLGSVAALILKQRGLAHCALRTAHVIREWGSSPSAALLRAVFNRGLFPRGLDAQVGVSQAVCAALQRPVVCIPNALPEEEAFETKAGISFLGSPVIGSVGRLTAQKDYPTLLRAAALLKSDWPDLRLVIIGDGEERSRLQTLAVKLGLTEQMTLPGAQTNIPAWLAGLDVFVLSSLWEGLPTALLEAMRAGIPVVATDIPGTHQLVLPTLTGRLVPPGDAAALAAALRAAVNQPQESIRMARAARLEAKQYSMTIVAQQYTALYRSCLNKAWHADFRDSMDEQDKNFGHG